MCKCIQKTDLILEKRGLRLVTFMQFRSRVGRHMARMDLVLPIELEKIDKKSRKKIPLMACNFCPLCGEKVPYANERQLKE